MIKSLRKILNTEKEKPEMTTQTEAPVLDNAATLAQLATANEQLTVQTASLAELTGKFTELNGKFEAAQSALTAVTEAKAALEAQVLETKMAARKERVVAVVGDEKAAAFLSATAGLNDEAFNAVANSLAGSFAAEAQGKMFTEVGATAEANAAAALATAETPLQKQLREKYQTKAA